MYSVNSVVFYTCIATLAVHEMNVQYITIL